MEKFAEIFLGLSKDDFSLLGAIESGMKDKIIMIMTIDEALDLVKSEREDTGI